MKWCPVVTERCYNPRAAGVIDQESTLRLRSNLLIRFRGTGVDLEGLRSSKCLLRRYQRYQKSLSDPKTDPAGVPNWDSRTRLLPPLVNMKQLVRVQGNLFRTIEMHVIIAKQYHATEGMALARLDRVWMSWMTTSWFCLFHLGHVVFGKSHSSNGPSNMLAIEQGRTTKK